MRDPRYAIIPARAVTDDRLEGRDLQVLCFLGKHTDRLGWCFLSQVRIAKELRCGRGTVQRSLGRLIDAGFVQVKESSAHACHAYRVVMDFDDPEIGPSQAEIEEAARDGGCPPAGTPAHQRAGVPAHGRAGGAHAYAGTERPSHVDDGGGKPRELSPGSRQGLSDDVSPPPRGGQPSIITPEALNLADEIAAIAGHDPKFLPPEWISAGPALRTQMMLDRGWSREVMLTTAKAVMGRKRDGAPISIRYFEKPFATAYARHAGPLPLIASVQHPMNEVQEQHREKLPSDRTASGWRSSRDNFRVARADFKAGVAAHDAATARRSERNG